MAITGIFGVLGSGKGIVSNYLIKEKMKKGRTVVTHTQVNYPHVFMEIDEIFRNATNDTQVFRDKILFIDEFHLIMESRRSSAGVNVDFAQQILIQLGKLDCDFIFTTQLLSQVDLRIREMTNYFYFVEKVIRPTDRTFDRDKRILRFLDGDKELVPFDIDVIYLERQGQMLYDTSFTFSWELLQSIFKDYDTREIVKFDRNKYLRGR